MAAPRARYACDPDRSRGRLFNEPSSKTRSPFRRDCDRVIHSTAFRRLKYKTQVFVFHEGDHYRTRLTHSIEVAQIARSIGRALGLNEDLAEAVALAHDLGHPPFGHSGEDALAAAMAEFAGFDHNEQTFRVLTQLERHYAEFDGLNLTWECLEGVAKHNGPLLGPGAGDKARARPVPPTIAAYSADRQNLDLAGWPSAEAQAAAVADDIAYNNHDIDDGLRAGLFTIADLASLPLVGPVFAALEQRYPGLEPARLIHEAVRRLIDAMVTDVIDESRRRFAEVQPATADQVRGAARALVGFSTAMRESDRALKQFLFNRMYRHYKVNRMTGKARRVVAELFELYLRQPDRLPTEWHAMTEGAGTAATARLVADYIAGMTDRFALDEHRRLFDVYS